METKRERLPWQKIGGGSARFYIDGVYKIIKPGERFSAFLHEIPDSFRDVVISIDPEKLAAEKEKADAPMPKEVLYEVVNVAIGWFNVMEIESKKMMSEKKLRKPKAIELKATLEM